MMPFRKILFPVDFSEATTAMVPHVTEMAQRFNATLTVLNAFNLIDDYVLAPPLEDRSDLEPNEIPYSAALRELRNQRERRLQEFSRSQFPRLAHTAVIEDGDPAMVIEWVAKRDNTDLIMMPTKGLGRFHRLLLGSVTAKVLHDISCPLFTSTHEPHSALAPFSGYRSILCAVGPNAEADDVLKAAALLAQAYGARICLLHMEPSSDEHARQTSAESIRHAFEQALNIGNSQVDMDMIVRVQSGAVARRDSAYRDRRNGGLGCRGPRTPTRKPFTYVVAALRNHSRIAVSGSQCVMQRCREGSEGLNFPVNCKRGGLDYLPKRILRSSLGSSRESNLLKFRTPLWRPWYSAESS